MEGPAPDPRRRGCGAAQEPPAVPTDPGVEYPAEKSRLSVTAVTVERSRARYCSGVSRICRSCERSFKPSSRHLDCPACRSRNDCTCGNRKQSKSETCWSCWLEKGQADSANHYWKGGRTTHQAGYLMVRIRDHPRAKTNGYVFEHIVVMEWMLGRAMLPDESVHHRNGVRDDNRPENLELWVRPQPSGIRKDDAIAWAREMLERYGAPG
jgi:HNH endonuclease